MMKKCQMILFLILLLFLGIFVYKYEQKLVWLQVKNEEMPFVTVKTKSGEKKIALWNNGEDEKYYIFLPSFIKQNRVYIDVAKDVSIILDGKNKGDNSVFEWTDNKGYKFEIRNRESAEKIFCGEIYILKSENLPSIFVETESGSLDYLLQSKVHEEQGNIQVIDSTGDSEFKGALSKISGRGNSTWSNYLKRSYSMILETSKSLCGLKTGKKWRLISAIRESSRLNTKIAMDIGKELNMPYTPDCTWIDLYMNGEYMGNYLLVESVTVGAGRVEIFDLEKENESLNKNLEVAPKFESEGKRGFYLNSPEDLSGGYLLEKDHVWSDDNPSGFYINSGDQFTIRNPEYASYEQVSYIRDYVQSVNDVIINEKDEYKKWIDVYSFVGKFLIDEIMLNYDAYYTSCYFIKEKGDELLYAGPMWDYDTTLGSYPYARFDSMWLDPKESLIIDNLRPGCLNWFALLYEKPEYYEQVVERYAQLLPYLEYLIETKIDEYADYVKKSALLDEIRWKEELERDATIRKHSNYQEDVQWVKEFMQMRVEYLNQHWISE